jgi:8-oxo-dGTP pyrophosphatase MutT (NUDIX family)
MNLIQQLTQFKTSSFCTVEEKPKVAQFLSFLETNPHAFLRENRGHITSSIWMVNAERTHALLTHHKKFNEWIQLGGHNDGNQDCMAVAALEALEESGILGLQFMNEGIFDIDIHEIPGPCAYHYDVRYVMQAPTGSNFIISDESHDLAWVPFEKIAEYTQQPSVLRMNDKFRKSSLYRAKNS